MMLDDGGLYGVTYVVGLSDGGRSFGIALRITGVCVCVCVWPGSRSSALRV